MKTMEGRCVMVGLHTPQTAVQKIVEEATPRDKIVRALNVVLEDQRKWDPTTH